MEKVNKEIEIIKMKGMKVKCLEDSDELDLKQGKIYDVISIEEGFYRIIDESDEDYIYPPEMFKIIEKGHVV